MTETEADRCIADYRAMLKQWTMCIVGLCPGDSEAMARELNQCEQALLDIAELFPNKSYSVDILVNARKRTWAGYEDERVPKAKRA